MMGFLEDSSGLTGCVGTNERNSGMCMRLLSWENITI